MSDPSDYELDSFENEIESASSSASAIEDQTDGCTTGTITEMNRILQGILKEQMETNRVS